LRQALAKLAGLLDRPSVHLSGCARSCEQELRLVHPDLGFKLAEFARWTERTSWFEIDEIYRATFSSDGWCPASVAWHLFPPMRRPGFLVRLRAHYRLQGFVPGSELSDHVSTLLRFAARDPQACEFDGVIEFCVRPALRRMRARLATSHPYATALDAIVLYLAVIQGRHKQPLASTG
jgi:nitrate reductase assembly molybdenum cofactor insertion protein NarJ